MYERDIPYPNGLVNLDANGSFRYNGNVPAPVETRYMVSFAPLYSTGVGFFCPSVRRGRCSHLAGGVDGRQLRARDDDAAHAG